MSIKSKQSARLLRRQPFNVMQGNKRYLFQDPYKTHRSTIETKGYRLTQQFIGISTTIDTWTTCFDCYRVIFRLSNNTDPISKVVKCTVGSPMLT